MDSDFEEASCNNINKKNFEEEQSKIEQAVSPKNTKVKLKKNWKRKQILYKGY